MGHKRRRRETQPSLLVLSVICVFLFLIISGTSSKGEVGCLFSKNLCNNKVESCFNDLAFGRCIQVQDKVSEQDSYQYNLKPKQLEQLQMQLEQLENEGYNWSHDYTQCVMQFFLDDLRYRLNNHVDDSCKNLKWQAQDFDELKNKITVNDKDISGAISERLESQENLDSVTIVKFNPSRINPLGDLANTFYYPSDELSISKQRLAHAIEGHQSQKTDQHDDSGNIELYHVMDTISDNPVQEEHTELPIDSDLDDMLWSSEIAGFKRKERLDVKKPGPLFSTNNYAFKPQSRLRNEISNEESKENDVVYFPLKKEKSHPKFKNLPKTYENVDTDHVYIVFNQEMRSWDYGKKIVKLVAILIGLDPKEFSKEIRVGRAEITFKVPKNSKNYNATDIVKKIDSIRNDVNKQLNLEIISTGIGDKNKLPAMLEIPEMTKMNPNVFGAMVVASTAAVIAAAIVILVIARRHAKFREKLACLRTPDPEASKDYQELCRARMQAKQSESPRAFDFGRLIESGRSESNRSSTSSWGEEPSVTSVDIATGHLILSYIEEHLKNTDKLDEEWATLSSYEPDPCSVAIADAEGNSECNRSDASLPYDYSRVVLNDLANLNNSDYINASTITDHDPRNPAYIATQGPLPQTAPDFWQLIWEQGSVVIIMLTRLSEAGQAMCHRYWPEEGSELYHIYEVHLVSEHIWCDDYLVRSFYLKNLRTGETRTVTQFHFLAWPNNSIPISIKTLLEFRRKVNKSYRGRSCPIIVHCSDGAGRTGSYCLLDMILNRISKGTKDINIAATLEHIRDQRANMVGNKQQYEFVFMAVAEEVHANLKSLPGVADKSSPLSSTD